MATKRTNGSSAHYSIVVGFDFSPQSEAALREAIDLAGRRQGGEVHVVHALDSDRRAASGRLIKKLDVRIVKATAKLRRRVADARAELLAQANPSALAMHIRVRGAAKAIVQASVDLDADLIVVGTRRAKGLKGLVTGSTGAKVVKLARCPVLVAKAKTYAEIERSASIEPQCPDCVATRHQTNGDTWWCTRHESRTALPLHIYSYSLTHPFARRDMDVLGPAS